MRVVAKSAVANLADNETTGIWFQTDDYQSLLIQMPRQAALSLARRIMELE